MLLKWFLYAQKPVMLKLAPEVVIDTAELYADKKKGVVSTKGFDPTKKNLVTRGIGTTEYANVKDGINLWTAGIYTARKNKTESPIFELASAEHLISYLKRVGFASIVERSLAMIVHLKSTEMKIFELTAILGPIIGVRGSEATRFKWRVQGKEDTYNEYDPYAGIIVTNTLKAQDVYHPWLSARKPIEVEVIESDTQANRDKFAIKKRTIENYLEEKREKLIEDRIPFTAHQMSIRSETSKCYYYQILYMNMLGPRPRVLGCISRPGCLAPDPYMVKMTPEHNLTPGWISILMRPSRPGETTVEGEKIYRMLQASMIRHPCWQLLLFYHYGGIKVHMLLTLVDKLLEMDSSDPFGPYTLSDDHKKVLQEILESNFSRKDLQRKRFGESDEEQKVRAIVVERNYSRVVQYLRHSEVN